MEGFVTVNESLINTNRLLAIRYKPEKHSGIYDEDEHYLAVFD